MQWKKGVPVEIARKQFERAPIVLFDERGVMVAAVLSEEVAEFILRCVNSQILRNKRDTSQHRPQ